MSAPRLLASFPDGHAIRRDALNWMVSHPFACANAKRGDVTHYAKETYFASRTYFLQELSQCGISLLENILV